VTAPIRSLIRQKQALQLYSAIHSGGNDGMITMNESLKRLFASGAISEEAALSHTTRPQELSHQLRLLTLAGS
jgi:twitching motility protein PilT